MFLALAIDGILFPTFFAYIAEIAPPALISFGYTASELVALVANFLSPYFFGNASPRRNFVYGVPVQIVVQFLNLLMVYFFFIDSYGLEKSQIYKKLRGIGSKVEPKQKAKTIEFGSSGSEKKLGQPQNQGRAEFTTAIRTEVSGRVQVISINQD